MGLNRHLIQDEELGEIVTYTVPDAAAMLGITAKTLIARATPAGDARAEIRGWAPKTATNPNRSWVVDASQIDALADADVGRMQSQLELLRQELDVSRERAAADLEQITRERAALADEMATAAMERSEYRQATLDAALRRVAEVERERDQARAAVRTLTATVNALTD